MSESTSASDGDHDFDTLVESAQSALSTLEDVDDLEALEDDQLENLVGNVDAMSRLLGQVEDLLEAVDFSELPDAVDTSELLEAIDTGEIPEALTGGDADDLVEVRQLFRALELKQLWGAADVGDLWQTKRELGETVEGMTGEGDGDDDGIVDSGGEMLEGVGDEFADELGEEFGSLSPGDGDGFGLDASDTKAYQTMIQQKAFEGIDEFRDALVLTHGKFQELYEFNREKMRRQEREVHSRNPTAVSTIPLERADVPSTVRHSTVPQRTRHSDAPTRRRIYGPRFEQELERLRAQENGDTWIGSKAGGDGGKSDESEDADGGADADEDADADRGDTHAT